MTKAWLPGFNVLLALRSRATGSVSSGNVIGSKVREIAGNDIVTMGNEESCPWQHRNFVSKAGSFHTRLIIVVASVFNCVAKDSTFLRLFLDIFLANDYRHVYVVYYEVSLTERVCVAVQVVSLLPKNNPKDL